jgi:hypothetical protein
MQPDSKTALVVHLRRFPEDLLDIRRLLALFDVSTVEVSEVLDEIA